MTSVSAAPRTVVFHDRGLPACLRVSWALRLPLWGQDSRPLTSDDRLIVVLARSAQARQLIDGCRRCSGHRPSLVVAWGLPERDVIALLNEGVCVVDGSLLSDPADALAALDDGWDSARFAMERSLAEALAEMEAHLLEGALPCD